MVNRNVLRSPDWHGSLKAEPPQKDANLRILIEYLEKLDGSDCSHSEYDRIRDLVEACEEATVSPLDVSAAFVVSIGGNEAHHLYLV